MTSPFLPWVPVVPASTLPPQPTGHPAYHPLVHNYALILTGISCITSILGCIGIFVTFFRFPEYRSNSRKLLLYLTIADILTAIGNLIGVVRYYIVYKVLHTKISQCGDVDAVCKVQSYITTVSNLWSFFWMSVISFYFIVAIVTHNIATADRMMIPSHVISWGVPVIIVSAAAGVDVLGEDLTYTSGGWCWITRCTNISKGNRLAWMLVTGKLWEFACYIILIINYAVLKYKVWMRMRYSHSLRYQSTFGVQGHGEYLAHNDKMFIFVPIILLVLRIWGTVKFILSTVYNNVEIMDDSIYHGQEVLTVLQGIGDSGQGFWNFILFCVLTKDIRLKLFSCNNQRNNSHAPLLEDSMGSDDSSGEEDPVWTPARTPARSPMSSFTSDSNRPQRNSYGATNNCVA